MSHFAFVAPPFLGHLHPMLALADALAARGDRITFFGIGDAEAIVGGRGHVYGTLGQDTHPAGTLSRLAGHMAAPHGFGFFRILRDMTRMTRMLCRTMPDACRAAGVDAIVTDQLEAAGGIVAHALGLPFVSVANALPINREPGVPPPFTDWPYDPSERALTRNRGGYRVADLLMRPVARTIAQEAGRLRAGPMRSLEDCLSPWAQITQLVPELDFPRVAMPATVHACGPLRTPLDATVDPDLLGPGRPIVFASLGTLQGGRAALFRLVATACAALDLHLVIAHGGRLTAAECASLPGSPMVRDFVPQRALLRHAALAITNGGLNTVLDAAAAGVPLLVVPIAFEQGAIAARVAHAGVGMTVRRRGLSAPRLQRSIEAALANAPMHDRARKLADGMARYGGAEAAADVIESVTGAARSIPPAAEAVSA